MDQLHDHRRRPDYGRDLPVGAGMMFDITFKLIDGEIFEISSTGFHKWLLPGEAATRFKYDGLLRPHERKQLGEVIDAYHAQTQKVA